ncbi:MAG: transcription elongation factor GreA [Alphaproteobacteria bacterium]|nr:transcription elongation factor GreA [Alphaproteobacteria bacterium]
MEKIPMTVLGFAMLQDELKRLKTIERPSVIEALIEARSHGDLSENAEYDAAKERQGFVEGRIADIEDKLRRADVIDTELLSGDIVTFGATVKLADEETDEHTTYKIVGVDEADIKSGKISYTSPVAKGLIGKKIGENVIVTTPRGVRSFEILSIKFG